MKVYNDILSNVLSKWTHSAHIPRGFLVILLITILLVPSIALSQWSTNPKINNLINNASDDQVSPASVSDGNGGAIFVWQDFRNGNYDIYAQRVNATGTLQWSTNGVAICAVDSDQVNPQIISDGNGGAIIAWQDKRGDDYDIYAQHVNNNGVLQWSLSSGEPVCVVVFDQVNISMASDGNGGALLAWEDYRSNAGPGLADIFTQKVSALGVTEWMPNGIGVCVEAAGQHGPKIISDEAGGAFITWYDQRAGDYDIYVQRVTILGDLVGIPDGVAVCTSGTDQTNPDMCSNGAGGVIIVWQDFRSTTSIDIWVQAISPAVAILWPVDGIVMNNNVAYDQVNPKLVSDGVGGAMMTWEDFRTGTTSDIYAQRVDSTGVVATGWNVNGVAVCVSANNQSNPEIISDNNNGAIITWVDKRDGVTNGDTYDIYASRITGAFALQGTANGSPICTVDSTQTNPTMVSDGNGGGIIAWQDKRNGNYDIYASHVFINVQANGLFVRNWQDDDGDVNTTFDQTLKAWHFVVSAGSVNGPVVVSGGPSLGMGNDHLTDGTYYATVGDSAPWVSLGYKINGSFVNGSAGTFTASTSLAGGESDTIDFYTAPPIYSTSFRSFNPDVLALEKDNLGKLGKSVKAKADKVQFVFSVIAPSNGLTGLHLEFRVAIDLAFDFGSVPASTELELYNSKLTKWNLTFTNTLDSGDVVTVHGYGSKGSLQNVSSYSWMTGGSFVGKKLKNPTFSMNVLRLPMPNRINVLEETFLQGGFNSTNGMVIGVAQVNKDSVKKYGWVYLKKSTDVLKSLRVLKGGVFDLHDGLATGFNKDVKGKDIVGKHTSFLPTKQDNVLFANLVALKFSIAASALSKTPIGFGDLILADTAVNSLNGMTLREIAAKADTMITGYAGRTFETVGAYANLSNTIRRVLDAFEGPMDTNSFASKLSTTGAHRLIDCKILKADTLAIPFRITPGQMTKNGIPERFSLYQNYPNPFNPATTIQFDLPFVSNVTLKIYNILGQEVASLLDHQVMEDGTQEVSFDASSLVSGVYLYRISTESVNDDGRVNTFTSIKKMMLIK